MKKSVMKNALIIMLLLVNLINNAIMHAHQSIIQIKLIKIIIYLVH